MSYQADASNLILACSLIVGEEQMVGLFTQTNRCEPLKITRDKPQWIHLHEQVKCKCLCG